MGGPYAAADQIGTWTIEETVSPLTGATTFSASTLSTKRLLNTLDRPEAAQLVLRCQEGVRAAYVVWPQVLQTPLRSGLLNLLETVVLKKIDQGPITAETWVVSRGYTAAGSFDNLGAPKIIASLHGAKQLVIRMEGAIQQDAVFDLAGVDEIISQVERRCGGGRVAALLPIVTDSPEVTQAIQGAPRGLPEGAQRALAAEGFTDVAANPSGAAAPMQPYKLTSRVADCGRMLGLPFIGDGRVKTQVAPRVRLEGGQAAVKLTISAVMKVGMGAHDKPLKCVSNGVIEREILEKIAGALAR